MTLTIITVVVLGLAAAGGWFVGIMHLRGKPVGLALGFGHGFAALAGLLLLIFIVGQGFSGTLPVVALVLFLASALGGSVLFITHLRKRPLPNFIILGHGVTSTVGFVLVLVRVIQIA